MLRRFLLLSSLLSLLIIQSAFRPALAQQPAPDFSVLEKVALDELKQTNTPGCAVAIVSGDRLVFAKGFGTSNIETGAPVLPEMLFRIGSTTKMFTAAALLTLAEEGKLKLDEPVGKYVKGLNPKVAQVTAHQLLTHTAGIIDGAVMFGPHDDRALGDNLRSWKEDYCLTEPGKIISYSNPGYWLAGLVIEEVGGKAYADQMAERLFKPLGMQSTTLRPTMAMTFPLALGHDAAGRAQPTVIRPMADNASNWPAGSIFSSVNDLARFTIALMNDGKLDGKQVLSPWLINKLTTPYVVIPGSESKYAYGLTIEQQRGLRVVQHGGSRSGYGSVIRMAPDHRFAVIVLANRTGISLGQTANKAMEMMLPLQARAEPPARQEIPMSAAEVARYAGVYVNASARVELIVKDGKLFNKQPQAANEQPSEQPVVKISENRFVVGTPNSRQEFVLVMGKDGQAEFLHRGLRSLKRIQAQQ
jgi:CubicO group peptidase (beta-lactamase class C family)